MNDFSAQQSGVSLSNNQKPISRLLFRNTFYNLFTQVILLIVALWSLPIIVRGLANERFGLLSLVWAIVGYFTLLDFGISRANTKFLSEALALNDKMQTRKLIWTSLFITGILGIASAIIIILVTPFLISSVFKIDISLLGEAKSALVLSAFSIPFMLIFGCLKGFQMALQRFEIVNIFQGIIGVVQWVGSVVLIWMGYGLQSIILLTIGIRILLTLGAFVILPRLIPHIYDSVHLWDNNAAKKLFSFGGWLTISQIISPLFLYVDRFFIGTFLSLTAVAYYSVPQEALSRLLIIPMSLTSTLFPALSEQSILPIETSKANPLYSRSIKYLFLLILPLVVIFIVYASDILTLWVGRDYAMNSVIIFQILSFGLLFNALAQIPITALHAFNRPDLTAKFHLIEFPVMIILNLILIPWIGIIGAAIVWSFRVILDAVFLFSASRRYVKIINTRTQDSKTHHRILPIGILAIIVLIVLSFLYGNQLKIPLTILFTVLYGLNTWFYVFDSDDRNYFLQIRSKLFG
jgi:O-antigen/teichoic acid export membrane protein